MRQRRETVEHPFGTMKAGPKIAPNADLLLYWLPMSLATLA
jgi:hypothetical protein